MKPLKTTLIFLLTILFQSCSFFIDSYENFSNKNYEYKKSNDQAYCQQDAPFQIFSEVPNISKNFPKWAANNEKFTQIEYFVLLSLIQMKSSPHVFSPTAAIDLVVNYNNQELIFNFSHQSISSPYPFLMGLKYLLTIFPHQRSLSELGKIVDKSINFKVPISNSFHNFLNENWDKIDNELKTRYFLRGSEILKLSESIQYEELNTLITDIENIPIKKILISSEKFRKLHPITFGPNKNKGSCNEDISKYEQGIYPKLNQSLSQHYGISFGNFHIHAVVNQIPSFQSLSSGPFFKNQELTNSSSICLVRSENLNLYLISSQSRDPSQHLYHLLQYNLIDISEIKLQESLQSFSRHLFLKNPPRLLYEANRGSDEQLKSLLKLDFPIYYEKKLGKITSSYQSKGSPPFFIIDDRHDMEIGCNL